MSTIKWNPINAQMINNAPNTIVVGTPGHGRKFYAVNYEAENGGKLKDEHNKMEPNNSSDGK